MIDTHVFNLYHCSHELRISGSIKLLNGPVEKFLSLDLTHTTLRKNGTLVQPRLQKLHFYPGLIIPLAHSKLLRSVKIYLLIMLTMRNISLLKLQISPINHCFWSKRTSVLLYIQETEIEMNRADLGFLLSFVQIFNVFAKLLQDFQFSSAIFEVHLLTVFVILTFSQQTAFIWLYLTQEFHFWKKTWFFNLIIHLNQIFGAGLKGCSMGCVVWLRNFVERAHFAALKIRQNFTLEKIPTWQGTKFFSF